MKIKTSELKDMALCYTLCMIEMPHLVWGKTIGEHEHSQQIIVPELPEPQCYSPFMGWEMFGPIIEREGISVEHSHEGDWYATVGCTPHDFLMWDQPYGPGAAYAEGSTPLIAAMRCYVASKFGEEVEVPDELIKGAN